MEKKVKKLIGYTPMEHQIDVHKLIRENPKGRTITVLAMRQVGKSLMAENCLIDVAINRPGSVSIYLAPTFRQSKKVFTDIKKAIDKSGCVLDANKSELIINFINGSSILFLSAKQKEALRGYNVSGGGLRVIDECTYISDDVLYITDPWCNVSNATTLLISTPFLSMGRFYESFQRGVIGESGYISIDWKNYDLSKLITKELIEWYRLNLPPRIFKSEVLGEFLTGDGAVFENFINCVYYDNKSIFDVPKYVGIDWATDVGNDETVVTYMNQNNRVLFQTVHKESSTHKIAMTVLDELNGFSNLEILAEATGIGRIYMGELVLKLKNNNTMEYFNTSNTSKRDIVEKLIVAFNKGEIEIPNDSKLLKQLELYGVSYNPKTQNVFYNAIVGNDDRVVSLCLAYHHSQNSVWEY